jgi:PAS domain S-box-containing protein
MPVSSSPRHGKRGQQRQGNDPSEARFLTLASASADIFWLLTPKGSMSKGGSSWHTFTGQGTHACLGYGWLDALHPLDRPQVETTLFQLATTGSLQEIECHLRQGDGTYHLLRLRALPVYEPAGTLHEVLICGTDLTRQAWSGHMSDVQLQLALTASRVGMWEWDGLTQQLLWTDGEKALFGWSPETPVTHERFLAALHPDDHVRVNRMLVQALTEPQEYHIDYRVIWPDGSVHWLSDRARSIADAQSNLTRLVGATVDITEVKRAEEQITAVLERISDAFSYVNKQWRYTYINRGLEKMIGKKREEVVGRSFWEMLPEIVGTPFERVYREVMETQQTRHIEGFHPSFRRWLNIHVYPTPDGISFDLQDITERKQAEDALRASEARFRGLVDSNLIGIAVSDRETIHEANDAFLDLVGYTQEDLAAGHIQWGTITPPEYQEQLRHNLEELATTWRIQTFEKEFQAKDGGRIPVLVGSTLFRREGLEPLGITFVVDLTARREIERQKDFFLGMTSHELKTPLAALRGMLQLVQRRMKRVVTTADHLSPEMNAFFEGLAKSLEDSVRQIDVQTRLINDLLDVSRITANTLQLALRCCDLKSMVRQTIEDLRVMAPERTILLDLPEQTMVPVVADQDRISQVTTNYVTNALRYSNPDQPVQVGLSIQKDAARLWVRDHGPGLTKEAQQNLWKRFQQVKGVPILSGSGKGLGLGLYICQTLIEQHQGKVGVESTPGEGSTFWFTLPLTPECDT